MAPQKKNTEINHDNASDETSTSNEKLKSPFEPHCDLLTNDSIRVINRKTTIINDRSEPEFLRDVCPYFAPTICNFGCVVTLILTGNSMIGGWVMFVGTPLYNRFMYHDN